MTLPRAARRVTAETPLTERMYLLMLLLEQVGFPRTVQAAIDLHTLAQAIEDEARALSREPG